MAIVTPPSESQGISETFGVTDPLSLVCSTTRDESDTKEMISYLDSVAPAESEEGWRERWEVLIDLEEKVSDWLTYDCQS